MHRFLAFVICTLAALVYPTSEGISETAAIGAAAPAFALTDHTGARRSLADFRGKRVVLEWYNPECPFVKKFYAGGEMQRLQTEVIAAGDIWLTINSSAPGRQGHIATERALTEFTDQGLKSTALLLDPTGEVGRQYGARTTPHIFVVDPQGVLAYTGAIDNRPSTKSSDIPGATNYVAQTLTALRAGKPVTPATTEPYGCSVKYGG
jgi:peroxiredoxin